MTEESTTNSTSETDDDSKTHLERYQAWLIWGALVLFFYVMRHFFLVIFLTFLVTYIMRSIVRWILKKIYPRGRAQRAVELSIIIASFLSLLLSLYYLGAFFGPRLFEQGQTLVKKLTAKETSSISLVDATLARTVGAYLFRQNYGEPSSEEYQAGLEKFRDPARAAAIFEEALFQFESSFETSNGVDLESDQISLEEILLSELSPADEIDFRSWLLLNKSPLLYSAETERYRREWAELYQEKEFEIPGLRPLALLPEREKRLGALRYITNQLTENEQLRPKLIQEWRMSKTHRSSAELREQDPELYAEQLREFYGEFQSQNESILPYSFETFQRLRSARLISEEAFYRVLSETFPESSVNESALERARLAFEYAETRRLVSEWKQGLMAEKLQKLLEEQVLKYMTESGRYFGERIPSILGLPIQLLLALLLSFLISIDLPRLGAGLKRLEHSRLAPIYAELAPGFSSFGKLLGRAFQAQGVIALVNTVFTLISIQLLGIQNAAFLCLVVFICSFVPVLGVWISSPPIMVMALIQEGGSITLALWALAAILIIHFLETSLLNPKILGDMLHLHPVLVLTILVSCEHFFGIWGLLLGIPIFVYVFRFLILEEGIPGFIEVNKRRKRKKS